MTVITTDSEPLHDGGSSYRRKPVSIRTRKMDSGLRRNDGLGRLVSIRDAYGLLHLALATENL